MMIAKWSIRRSMILLAANVFMFSSAALLGKGAKPENGRNITYEFLEPEYFIRAESMKDDNDAGTTESFECDSPMEGQNAEVPQIWKNGDVPYVVDNGFDSREKAAIDGAIAEFKKETCVVWRRKDNNDQNYVRFVRAATGCHSKVGLQKTGPQDITLGRDCSTKGVIMHEMMHTLGFHHEHQRPDRDKFVDVKSTGPGFNIVSHPYGSLNPEMTNYDYGSIMHFSKHACASDGSGSQITIEPKVPYKMGQQRGFSGSDTRRINELYGCNPPKRGCVRCWDASSHCNKWANDGKCSSDNTQFGTFMKSYCKRTCNICSNGETTTTTAATPSATITSIARTFTTPTITTTHTTVESATASTISSAPTSICQDLSPIECRSWMQYGWCYRESVIKKCQKTCKVCKDTTTTTTTTTQATCTDDDAECYKLAPLCGTKNSWLDETCKATCNLCNNDGKSAKVVDVAKKPLAEIRNHYNGQASQSSNHLSEFDSEIL